MNTMAWRYRLCRWPLGVIFIDAGSTKLLAPKNLAVLIEAYGPIPERPHKPVVIGLPLLEVIAGIGLLFDTRGSLALIAGLIRAGP